MLWEELYDHQSDSGEHWNLAANKKHSETVVELREVLRNGVNRMK